MVQSVADTLPQTVGETVRVEEAEGQGVLERLLVGQEEGVREALVEGDCVELSVAVAQVVALTVCELQSVVDTEALVEGLPLTEEQVVEVMVSVGVPEGL